MSSSFHVGQKRPVPEYRERAKAIKRQRRESTKREKPCFCCRKTGHQYADCPEKDNRVAVRPICFNCGADDHPLRSCPKPIINGGATYATCFICKQQGHLSSKCPKSSHGLYPNGGCCHVCGSKEHRYRDCPDRTKVDDGDADADSTTSKFKAARKPTDRSQQGSHKRFDDSPEHPSSRGGQDSGDDEDADGALDGDFDVVTDGDVIGNVPVKEARVSKHSFARDDEDERKGTPVRIVASAGSSHVKVVKTKTQKLKERQRKEESKQRQLAKAVAEKKKKTKPVKEVTFD